MTCIVALVDNGISYFAGDAFVGNTPSQYHSAVSQNIRKEPKVWQRECKYLPNGILFGANGAVRMLQLLRYSLEIPVYIESWSEIAYLVNVFIPAIQKCFKKHEYQYDELDGNILLSLNGKLFTIGKEFNVCDTADNYDAIGKASEVAIGSLHTTAQLGLAPLKRLYLALEAAEKHTCVVSEPFTYITSEMKEAEILPELTETL